jgi:hypothetical protein
MILTSEICQFHLIFKNMKKLPFDIVCLINGRKFNSLGEAKMLN